jgi:hypothetical protein
MPTDPRPDPPHEPGGAVGLVFVGTVLCLLFTAGGLGVLATRAPPAAPPGPATRSSAAVARPDATAAARGRIAARFHRLVRLRETALRERDPALLSSVWAPGSPGLARDRAELDRLRANGRRWDGLHLPVTVLDAYRRGRDWMVVARLGRSQAELVAAASGTPIRTVAAADATYHCPLVQVGDRWLLVSFAPS